MQQSRWQLLLASCALILAFIMLTACTAMPAPLATPTAITAADAVDPTTAGAPHADGLVVDAGAGLGPISPYIFGSNFGPWVALRPETLPLAVDSGVTVLRYPGGAWGDKNNLQPYQIDQFIQLARQMGAEPSINVRFPGGTPEQAAELVRYANVEQGYNVRYWAIGNEPSLYEAEGLPWTAASFSLAWRDFYAAMKAVDPAIIIMGPETHQFTGTPDVDPVDSQGDDWLRTFLTVNGDLVDMVSVHRYPFPNNAERTPASMDDLRTNAAEWDALAMRLREVVQATTGRDLPLAITEVNSHWSRAISGEATPDSFYNAIWWGDVLGRLINARLEMVNQFLLVSGPESGFGLLGRYETRPTYYTYQLYKRFGNELLAASSTVEDVSIYAARRDDGALTLMVINLSPEDLSVPLTLQNFTAAAPATVWRLDADHRAAEIDPVTIGDDVVLELPAQSMTLYEVQ